MHEPRESTAKLRDTAVIMAWLAWLFLNLPHDLVWPLSALKEIVQHAETCIGTMMRSGRYFTHSEWVEIVSSGHLLVKQWVRLAKQGVDLSRPFFSKGKAESACFATHGPVS